MPIDWKTLPSLSALRAFEAVARGGSFAEAARSLNVTNAAVAQQVRALEAELGVALARRTGRSISLTEDGARLARGLGDSFESLAAAVEETRSLASGRPVQIGATIYIAQSVILPRLDGFWARHPDILVSVTPTLEPVDLNEHGFDLAIRGSDEAEPDWPGYDADLLLESEMILFGAPSLVRDPLPPLESLPWIWSRGLAREERTLRAFGMDPGRLRNVDLGAPFLVMASARRGLGITFAPEIIAREDLAAGTLVRLPVPPAFVLRYFTVTPRGPVRPQARAFIDWLRDIVQDSRDTDPA